MLQGQGDKNTVVLGSGFSMYERFLEYWGCLFVRIGRLQGEDGKVTVLVEIWEINVREVPRTFRAIAK